MHGRLSRAGRKVGRRRACGAAGVASRSRRSVTSWPITWKATADHGLPTILSDVAHGVPAPASERCAGRVGRSV